MAEDLYNLKQIISKWRKKKCVFIVLVLICCCFFSTFEIDKGLTHLLLSGSTVHGAVILNTAHLLTNQIRAFTLGYNFQFLHNAMRANFFSLLT